MESDNPVIKLTGETKWSRTTKTVLCKNKAWHTPANTKINYKLRLMRQYVKKFKKKGSECFIGISIVEEDKEEHLWLSKHNKFSLNHLPLFNSFSFLFLDHGLKIVIPSSGPCLGRGSRSWLQGPVAELPSSSAPGGQTPCPFSPLLRPVHSHNFSSCSTEIPVSGVCF